MPKVQVVISPDGIVSYEGKGFKGDSCEKTIKKLIKDMGKKKSSKNKPEYKLKDKTSITI